LESVEKIPKVQAKEQKRPKGRKVDQGNSTEEILKEGHQKVKKKCIRRGGDDCRDKRHRRKIAAFRGGGRRSEGGKKDSKTLGGNENSQKKI